MSFGSGGFGGFGQANNNQSSGFGGFGQANNNNNNNATSGFGSGTTGGFGQTNPSSGGGGLFGSNTGGANAAGGFGSSTSGGFGSNTGSGFGGKPAFGSTTTGSAGGGLFGATNNTTTTGSTGFGGFGSAASNTNTSSPFGGGAPSSTGGGLFGNAQSKPAFGSTGAAGGSSLFGSGNTAGTTTTGTGFGGFGAANNTALSGATGEPPGTASTPFQAHVEKESNSTQSNSFQNILFQEPYRKWSSEELRLVDYAQGRRHGNGSTGGAGAFGSSNFGGTGFGSTPSTSTTGGGLFGNNNTASTANTGGGLFGNSNNIASTTGGFGQSASGGFGSNTGTSGGLFGSKPAATGGGLFGSTQPQQQQSTGFGSGTTGAFGSGNTGTGFGSAGSTAGGGLFGNNNQANKPAGGLFGSTPSTGTGFGGAASTGFGSAGTGTGTGTGGGLFGNNNNQQQQQPSGGLFGNNNTQQQQGTGSAFGGGFGQQNQTPAQPAAGGGLFGNNNQQKPAGGLFGNSTPNTGTGGGLFGGANNQQQSSTGFGQSASGTGGGLFGNKPATPAGGSLFGQPAQQSTGTGGGLFGNNNQQQNQQTGGTGLFGNASSGQQQKTSLFGNSQSGGTGLFGGQNNQNQGQPMFGGSTNQTPQNQGMGSSFLGASQQSNNGPQGLTANLNDVSAYGSPSLFSNVGSNEVSNPGPLATSVNGNSRPKRGSILPMYKLAPSSASRYATPQKRGFGFSYSTYGTPGGSPASSIASTPGTQGRSFLSSSVSTGALSKSMSTNNLRRNFNSEDSILAPGAFSANSAPRWYGSTGSKKLVISRDMRSDLFTTPQKEKQLPTSQTTHKLSKRVSFDTSVDSSEEPQVRGALPATDESPVSQPDDTPRQNRTSDGLGNLPDTDKSQGALTLSLSGVEEEESASTPGRQSPASLDTAPGAYWTQPCLEDLQAMNRVQRQKIDGFVIGRDNVGSIAFKQPVDISGIEIDELCGGIVQLEPRSATVYPVTARKPPMGKGLNVPARITLEQSWPRGSRDKRSPSDLRKFAKHVERLKRIPDTEFETYEKDTGVWVFSVQHFTTYGLDDSDEDSDDDTGVADPQMADANLVPSHMMALDASVGSSSSSMGDDTFQFRRSQTLPGAFDEQAAVAAFDDDVPAKQSFLGVSSADSAPSNVRLSLEEEQVDDMGDEYDVSDDEDMTRSSLGQHHAAEPDDASSQDANEEEFVQPMGTPGGILRARMRALKGSNDPVQLEVADGDDWTEMLRKTVSPAKRDRQLLREINEGSPTRRTGQFSEFDDSDGDDVLRKSSVWRKSTADKDRLAATSTRLAMDKGRGFATSIDLMNSLFEKPKPVAAQQQQHKLRASTAITPAKGFPEWPYERQDKVLTIEETEKAFHDGGRPTWGPNETLVVTRPIGTANGRSLRDTSDILSFQRSTIHSEHQAVRLATFSADSSKRFLRTQDSLTDIVLVDDVPSAKLRATNVQDIFHHQNMNDPASIHEKWVWELAGILFDDMDGAGSASRKSRLSAFWAELVGPASSTSIGLAATPEEKAVACLAGHRIAEACKHLLEGKNFRLATLVPLIGTSNTVRKDMREQVKAWHDSKMLSEFSEPIRAIYELLGGNTCVCEGMKGVPVEDRMESFVISKKFGLDWKQAFGLRLWYAVSQQDDLKVAVGKFQQDIIQDREDVPQPWYLEQGIQPLWFDYEAHHRQDLLWGLLQLYADADVDLEAVLRPENSQLSPLDMRLCWQLGVALVATGKVSFGDKAQEKADAATLSYAAQLTSSGEWMEAIFVLLHLSDATARQKAIQEHLCRHAGLIGPETDANFSLLTDKFRIPATWIWEALALYMRSVRKDATAEVQCLLKAGSFVEAHRVLVRQVAPQAIIERGYADLAAMMAQFDGHRELVSDWHHGGEVYTLFLSLVQHRARGEAVPRPTLDRLLAGLHAMNESVGEDEIIRFAALSDMADEAAKEIVKMTRKKQDVEFRWRILKLPLTQDRLLAYSVDLGMERYKEVMSH
ncbi:nuclear pore complex protein Nup98-Nup96 [Geosmithia morbida]|uniref:Nuclear pore complex protein Nup98-Nup96 n=1 Tax=Geosmithia morbida TaxID=1094350 RepID=A0A9P5D4D4_9HYPO|nr:nuclear pore complex protein Nup98-Nup96 [Geosmithia morbida]KAF4122690.1 nuclear pore complex protein Nup98-Nup96 [Geosmithia morbida]